MKVIISAITYLVLISVLITGCSTLETPTDSTLTGGTTIVCEVFYRRDAGVGMEAAPLIIFEGGNEQISHQ